MLCTRYVLTQRNANPVRRSAFHNLSATSSNTDNHTPYKYGFILLRATPLTDATHVSFSRLFASGSTSSPDADATSTSKEEEEDILDSITRFLPPTPSHALRIRYYPHLSLFDASNLTDDGTAILDPSLSVRAALMKANALWHSDLAYNPRRSSYSLLRAVELPPFSLTGPDGEEEEVGGNTTEFADSRTAWEEFPDLEMKERMEKGNWTGVYNAAYSRKLGAPDFFRDVNVEVGPMARHKVLQEHRESGRMNLCVGAYLWRLELHDNDNDRKVVEGSEEIIKRLNEHVAQKKYVTSVRWEQPGDLVIWDNRAVLHRAGEFKGMDKYRRDMRRTTAFDTGPTAWGLNGTGAALPTLESMTKGKGPGA